MTPDASRTRTARQSCLVRSLGARWSRDPAKSLTYLALLLCAVQGLLYLVLGQVNADEGWYLYASRLVFQGLWPHRDFAYTQMPLLPYIYGVWQIASPGLEMGRMTSLVLSLGTIVMGVAIARRHAGARGGVVAAWFFAAYTFGAYFDSIVKTYALVAFCFTATLFCLTRPAADERRYLVAIGFALAAALVRLTAVLFVIPILFYVLWAATRWRTRLAIVGEGALASGIAALFLLPDWPAARWDLFDSHLRHWAGAQVSTQIDSILSDRVPDLALHFGPALALFAGAIYFAVRTRGIRFSPAKDRPIWVTAFGLGLFAASHLVNGLWEIEYLVPAAVAFIPILAIVLTQVYDQLEERSRLFVQGTWLAVLVFLLCSESIYHIDITGHRLPLSEVDTIASLIEARSGPADKILALETLAAVVKADRATLPGLTLAQFSVQLLDTAAAEGLHVVNTQMLAAQVKDRVPKMVILTEYDWGLLYASDPTSTETLQDALTDGYQPTLTMSLYGQYASEVKAYVLP